MIKILLVDDHELVRTGIETLLNLENDISVVAVTDCGEKVIDILDQVSVDVILMDINMPGIGGIEACRRVLQQHPEVKIIALSAYNSGPIPQQLLKLGALGFISKGSPVSEMVTAIRAVIDGKRFLCSEVATNLAFQSLPMDDEPPFTKLSQREAEVVELILQGKSIKEIAEQLNLSDKTINTYRYRLYSKLNVKNDVELTRLAVKFNHIESGIG